MSTQTDSELREKITKLRFPIIGVEYDGAQKYYTFKNQELDRLMQLIESDRRKSVEEAVKDERLKFLITLDERGLLNDKGKLKLAQLSRPNTNDESKATDLSLNKPEQDVKPGGEK